MKFILLGMGSVGSLWACMLYELDHDIVGLCRGRHYNEIKKNGLHYFPLSGSNKIIPEGKKFKVFNEIDIISKKIEELDVSDWVIITTKAYDLENVIKTFSKSLEKHGSILLFQNGIGNEDIVKNIIPNLHIFRATTTMGSYIFKPGNIRHTGIGFTRIGYPKINYSDESGLPSVIIKQGHNLLTSLNKIGYDIEYSPDIDLILWEKIFINIGINAPAAINNIPNGKLVDSEKLRKLMHDAITEAWKVGRKLKVPLKNDPDDYIKLAYDVARKTAENKNSMLQDLLKKKPTEIDFINGKIVEYAKVLGIETPINEKLTVLVKKLEREY